MNGNDELEWNWIRVSVIEVVKRKNGMEIDGNEWRENMDANRQGREEWVVMRVKEVELGRKKDGIMNRRE